MTSGASGHSHAQGDTHDYTVANHREHAVEHELVFVGHYHLAVQTALG